MSLSPPSESSRTQPAQSAQSSLAFADIFGSKLFAVIDFETTGLNPATDRILQMAAVVVDITGHVIDSFDTIVKPEQPSEYTHGAEHVHGISTDDVDAGMPLGLAMRRLQDISQNALFTAHNARFDLGFLHAELARVGQSWNIDQYVDTLFYLAALTPIKSILTLSRTSSTSTESNETRHTTPLQTPRQRLSSSQYWLRRHANNSLNRLVQTRPNSDATPFALCAVRCR